MKPYASGKRWTLYAGDCVVAPVVGADAIVTEPPFGIAYEKGAGGSCVTSRGTVRERKWGPIAGDDVDFDPTPWLAFPRVLLWGANHYAARLPRGRWLAWNKLGDFEPFGDSFADVELGWCNQRGADRIFSLLWKGVRQGEKYDNGVRLHPSQKPIGLCAWWIEQLALPVDSLVCDPYTGSASVGVATLLAGHRFVGVEIDPAHLDIAARRLGQAESDGVQSSLFG